MIRRARGCRRGRGQPCLARTTNYTSRVTPEENTLAPFAYKGYTIRPRTFQLRGSDRWTLDLLIDRKGQLRAFGGPTTYATEAGASTACTEFGCRIIDGVVKDCSVADLR